MEMVKRYILILVAAVLLSSTSLAATFSWDQVNFVCYGTCGGYIIVWRVADYEAVCPADVLEEETDCRIDPVGCTEHFVPASCYDQLKVAVAVKIKILPESYETIQFTVRKSNAPTLAANNRFVSVVTAYEVANDKEFESDFSNRIVWKTPIAIKPFEILLEAP